MTNSGITSPKGFKAAGVACGLKKNGNRDLALVVSDTPAKAAGIFTTNVVKGHSLQWSREKIKAGIARAVVINSGCANACVGPQGDEDAALMAQLAAQNIGCKPEEVMLGSTGVIGFRLDMKKIEAGLAEAFRNLSDNGGNLAAQAIMTTDTYSKEASTTFVLDGKTVTIGGMAKGSGMIHPNMATMISVVTTDIAISYELLDKAIKTIADKSYNRVSVDGDTSVCDKVLILANGAAGNTPILEEGTAFEAFCKALEEVCVKLSKMLAKDGEGATKLIELNVKNASDKASAHLILNAIAKSPLVKTAFFGQDANWGRIFTAAGYSGASFDPNLVDIYLGELLVCKNGVAVGFDEEKALTILKEEEVIVTLDFKAGNVSDRLWTCDFSYDYVKINGSYRS
ncbi:MAG: bifunctional glutamate N-acetyltransferase/amino-acid acetyltransferase ArgJ [Clostridia bacterium]|nr:bifunctional glutamate N-acetyltransferase/amino-acid acetyltransferase ArgJ [Clostridia bacterium]